MLYLWTAFSYTQVGLLLKTNRFLSFFMFIFFLNTKAAITCFYVLCHQNLLHVVCVHHHTHFWRKFTTFCVWNCCAVPSSIAGSNKDPVPHQTLVYTGTWHHFGTTGSKNTACQLFITLYASFYKHFKLRCPV